LRRTSLSLTAVLALLATSFLLLPPSSAADKDCSDFATQRAAQIFYLKHNPKADPHNLDGEGDGIACESNPCPCKYNQKLGGGGKKRPKQLRQRARIIRVVDGDTVDVRLNGHKRRVRLLGINTPEVYGGVECGGKKASASLKRLLPRRARVRLFSDPSQARRDRYGRALRYIHRRGHDINKIQVRRGWARVYVYNHNRFRRTAGYRKVQRAARSHDRGIWGRC
jgi:endonuclease YncB( thermonuclease family)